MKRTEQKVLRFIEQQKLISAGDKLLIAFSGGPDSVFALNFLSKYRKKYKIDLLAVHFNHGLRGKESDHDEEFAKEFSASLNIPIISKRLSVKTFAAKNKISIEEAARKLRYKNLKDIAIEKHFSKIVTAHNKSDNTETILLNLFSGTGLSGLSGIPIMRGKIIRPIMCLTKQEITEYLEHKNISYRVDSSNESNDFKRNYIRNRILTLIKLKLNPEIDDALFRSLKNFDSTLQFNKKFVDYLIVEYVSFKDASISIRLPMVKIFDGEIPGEILKEILKKNFDHEFGYDDYLKINSLIGKQKGKRVQISKKYLAQKESDCISIQTVGRLSNEKIEIKVGEEIKFGSEKIGIEQVERENVKFRKDGKVEFISPPTSNEKFILRMWKSGDKFKPLGMNNFKKVSDFLTDVKIPASQKKNQLVLTIRNQIAWIVGLRIDERFKLNSNKRKIFKVWVK